MNIVNITGKIIRIKNCNKVLYCTILTKNTKKENEYVPVTIFNPDFFLKYFKENQWISITGHIHINNVNNEYITEIIVDNLYFCGDKATSNDSNEFTQADVHELPWEIN